MDFNSILMSGLIGALSIGGAVGVGELMKRVTPNGLHGAITVAAIAVGLITMTILNDRHDDTRNQNQIEKVILQEGASGSELFKLIKEHYPEEYQGFLVKARSARTHEDGERIGAELSAGIRRLHADNFLASSEAQVANLFNTNHALTVRVAEDEGWQVCNAFLNKGGIAIMNINEAYSESVAVLAVDLLRVLAEAKDRPSIREAASEEDWAKFIELWRGSGGTQTDLELVMSPDFKRQETCDAFLSLYDKISRLEGDLGDRIRTDFLVSMAKS